MGVRSLFINSGSNLLGQVLPFAAAVVCIPILLNLLGMDRFGVLSFCWLLLGYFSTFDLGVGRALTKRVSERSGRLASGLPTLELLTTALSFQLTVSLLLAAILAVYCRLILTTVAHVPDWLLPEAVQAVRVLALGIPLIYVTNTFYHYYEGVQRFDIVNLIRAPTVAGTFLGPVAVAAVGGGLPAMVLALLAFRTASLFALWLSLSVSHTDLKRARPTIAAVRDLVSFGKWVTVTSVVGPVLIYLDRFLVGSLLGLRKLGLYTAVFEPTAKLGALSGSLKSALFPAISQADARGQGVPSRDDYVWAAIRITVALFVPLMVAIAVFSDVAVSVWLGSSLAETELPAVMSLLAIGVLFNSLANPFLTTLQAQNRPAAVAVCHLVELVFYPFCAYILIRNLGLSGAGLSWCLRAAVDAALLAIAAIWLVRLPPKLLLRGSLPRNTLLLGFMAGLAWLSRSLFSEITFLGFIALAVAGTVVYVGALWAVLTDGERAFVTGIARRFGRDPARRAIH